MKISVLTVVYNGEKTIGRTIESIITQDYLELEYIIVDGNSKDNTLAVIEPYKDKIAKVISEPDTGIYDAMNKAIGLATGEYICLINADDWLEPNIISEVAEYITRNPNNDIYHGNVNYHYEHRASKIIYPQPMNSRLFWIGMPIFHSTMFVKNEVYQKINYDTKYRLISDFKFVLETYLNGYKYNYMNKTIANFSEGGASTQNKFLGIKEGHKIRMELGYNPILVFCSTIMRLTKSLLFQGYKMIYK